MVFEAVAFVSGEDKLSEREKAMADRFLGRDVLFLVMCSESKAELLRQYVEPRGQGKANIVCLHAPDSRYLLPYLARETYRGRLEIDVTFASPYYASAVTLISKKPGVRIAYTMWDGHPQVIYQALSPKTEYNDVNYRIVKRLSSGPKTLAELEKETGLNYKTLARRAASLLAEGAVSKTDEYPIRYYATDEQVLTCQLSPNPYDEIIEGRVFLNAVEALFSQDRVVLDCTMPKLVAEGEMNLDTCETSDDIGEYLDGAEDRLGD